MGANDQLFWKSWARPRLSPLIPGTH